MYKSIGSHFQDNRTLLSLVKLKIDRIKKTSKYCWRCFRFSSAESWKRYLTFYHCLLGLGDGPHPCTEGTTQHDTRHDIGFSGHRLKIQLWHRTPRLGTNSLKPNYQDLNGNLLLKTFKMYTNRHFKLHIPHKEMSLGCFLLFPALRTSVLVSFDFLKKTRENSGFLALTEKSPKFNSSSTPVPTNLRLSGDRRLFFLKRQFRSKVDIGLKNLAKRDNLSLALLSVRYPSRRTNEGFYSCLGRY